MFSGKDEPLPASGVREQFYAGVGRVGTADHPDRRDRLAILSVQDAIEIWTIARH
jgi:hypothetical protein